MKKIIFIFLTFLLCFGRVRAEIFYSDYGNFGEYSETYIENSDTKVVESERRYKIYYETEAQGDYYIESENPITLPFIDKANFIETAYSSWSKVKPEEKLNRSILEKDVYEYWEMQKIRYIHVYSIHGSNGGLSISEIEVHSNGQKIDYMFSCENCRTDSFNSLNNGNTHEDGLMLQNDAGLVTIDLGDYYDLSTITFNIYLYDTGSDVKIFALKYTKDADFSSNIYAKGSFKYYFSCKSLDETKLFTSNINDYDIIIPDWEDSIVSDEEILETKTRKVEKYKVYSFKDIKYRYFNYDKVYADGYYKNPNDIYTLVDKNLYKDFYRFKTRDKIVISDSLKITSYAQKLEDFILESTINNIKITGNVDYTKNGFYDIVFELPFKNVSKKIEVSILENDYNLLKEELEEKDKLLDEAISNLEDTKEKLNELLSKVHNNEELIKNYEEQIEKLNESLLENSDKETIKELNKIVETLNKEKEQLEKENSILLDKISTYESTIKEMNELINVLKTQNDEYLKQLNQNNQNVENLVSQMEDVYNKQNETISNLLEQISNLNEKINNQNHSIDLLVKYNNENAEKYKNEVKSLEILLNEEKEKNSSKSNELNVCLNDSENLLLNQEKYENKLSKNKVIVYIMILLFIIFSIFTLKKLNKKF